MALGKAVAAAPAEVAVVTAEVAAAVIAAVAVTEAGAIEDRS
jgi:hypothetical protein